MGQRLAEWSELGERVTGKWQIPALLFSLVALGLSLSTFRTPASKIPFKNIRDKLPGLVDRGQYTAAIEAGSLLLNVPNRSARELGPVHAAVARARLLRADRNGGVAEGIGLAVIGHYASAVEGGYRLLFDDEVVLGRALEVTGDVVGAAKRYEAAIAMRSHPGIDLRWRLARLHADHVPVSGDVLSAELGRLIADAGDRPDVLTWALERKIDELCKNDRCSGAGDLLDSVADSLGETPWLQWLEYFRLYVAYLSGEAEHLEARLRHVRDALPLRDALASRVGWLLGRVVLGEDDPQRPLEAISIFREVSTSSASPLYAAASSLGMAEAFVMLERFDEALERYRDAVFKLKRVSTSRLIDRRAVESSLTVSSVRLQAQGRLAAALGFARQAVALTKPSDLERYTVLVEREADLEAALAKSKRAEAMALARGVSSGGGGDASTKDGDDSDVVTRVASLSARARELLLDSGALLSRVASLNTLDSDRSSDLAWRAAERIYESGDSAATVDVMRRFVAERSRSEFVPRALRLMGAAQQSLGLYEEAIQTYQEAQRRFPRTPDAGSSLIPLARCYVALGAGHAKDAEKTLRIILDNSEVFTPAAREYSDALLLLGDLRNRSGEYERAIPVFEEAMSRYPNDPRLAKARFLLGDSYLQSGMALKGDIEKARFAGERDRLTAERRRRLERAAELFGKMVEDYEARDAATLSKLESVYLRHARLYRADCHFELGEYDRALVYYERAAWIYKGTTTALSAYVQIINCHLFTGNSGEASSALRRAQYLVETMSDSEFDDGLGFEKRDDWRQYFAWVGRAELF